MEDKMTQTTYKKLPRELRYLSNIGLEDFEIDYLVQLKKKKDSSKHWKH